MKNYLLTFFALVFITGISAQAVLTCYDIQYTTDPTGNSPYYNQTVTVQGIVTHIIPNSAFYIADPEGGEWSGLYVYHRNTSNVVSVGDLVKLTGTVDEHFNSTEFTNVSAYEIISQGNALPPFLELSTANMPSGTNHPENEKYEGVLVRFQDVTIKSSPDGYGQFNIADSSNIWAMVDNGLYAIPANSIVIGESWYIIQGIVDFHSSAGFKLNPRNANDMIKQDTIENSIIKIVRTDPTTDPLINTDVSMNLISTKIKAEWGVQSYSVSFKLNPACIHFSGFDTEGTLTPSIPDYYISSAGDTISYTVTYQDGLIYNQNDALLIKILVKPLVYGESVIELVSFKYNDTNVLNLNDGSLVTKLQKKTAYLDISKIGDKKNIFNPEMGEQIIISYGTKTGYLSKAIVRIYDAQGRLVYTPVHTNITSSTGIENFIWNGRDANLKLLPPGLYYCHLEVIDRSSGDKDNTVQPIVIKSALK
ncbi:MAG: hypothetical protein PHH97_04450 [Candidatus Cloacimonetes bacterium]|jgi:hypothetical protein|nr:hypothetical protein [Candidatus Cloacimonadota bacterium]